MLVFVNQYISEQDEIQYMNSVNSLTIGSKNGSSQPGHLHCYCQTSIISACLGRAQSVFFFY